MSSARKLAAILAVDVAGYSRLMGEDEAGTAKASERGARRRRRWSAISAEGWSRPRATAHCSNSRLSSRRSNARFSCRRRWPSATLRCPRQSASCSASGSISATYCSRATIFSATASMSRRGLKDRRAGRHLCRGFGSRACRRARRGAVRRHRGADLKNIARPVRAYALSPEAIEKAIVDAPTRTASSGRRPPRPATANGHDYRWLCYPSITSAAIPSRNISWTVSRKV